MATPEQTASFAHQIVRDFLRKKGYNGALVAFDKDRKAADKVARQRVRAQQLARQNAKEEARTQGREYVEEKFAHGEARLPATDSWYDMSHALDIPDMHRFHVDRSGGRDDPLLEVFVRFLVAVRRGGDEAPAASSPLPGRPGRGDLGQGRRRKRATRPLQPVEEARAAMRALGKPNFMGSPDGLDGLEGLGGGGLSAKQARRAQKQRARDRAAKAAAAKSGVSGRGGFVKASVTDIKKRMDSSVRRQRDAEARAAAAQGAALTPGGRRRKKRGQLSASRSADALDFNEFQQRFAASFTEDGGLGDGPFPKSKESWIPFASRLDMIRRDLTVAKANIQQCAVHEEALARNQPRTTELARAKAKSQYGQKRQLFCCLCEAPFELINLPFSISYKAVLDLRRSRGWKKKPGKGVRDGRAVPACYKRAKEAALSGGSPGRGPQLGPDDDPSDKMAAVPRCYDQVRVCKMCAQWFEDAASYRPTAEEKSARIEDAAAEGHHMSDHMHMHRHGSGGGGSRVNVQVTVAGDGQNYPRKGATVTVHYTGYLNNGHEFDSTRRRGKPFTFKLGAEQVFKGLEEGVAQLSKGETATMEIPPDKAFGKDKGFPGIPETKKTLVYEVELLDFVGRGKHR